MGISVPLIKRLQMDTPSRISSMDQCVDEMIPPSLTNDTDFMKHLGVTVSLQQSGKWVAKIQHPIKKVWVCVGIYSTPEEASDAYATKKLEYEKHSVHETALSSHTNVADFEKQPGIKRVTSGKWMANIKHKNVRVYLGSYNTPNEAAYAYNLSKLELQSPKTGSLGKVGVAHKSNGFDGSTSRQECLTQAVRDAREDLNRKKCELGLKVEDAQEALNRKKCELNFKGDAEQSERNQRRRRAYLKKSGRWETEIRHPMTKAKRIYLGTFSTAKEAEDAYNNMKRQFELMFPGYMNRKQRNERVDVGTLTEEAKEAYNNKMREVDLMVRAHKKPRQSNNSCKTDAIAEGKSDSTCVDFSASTGAHLGTFTEEAEEVYSNKIREFDLMVCEHKKRERLKAISEADVIANVESVESVPMLAIEKREEFDLGIVDSHGRFVGEYSKMDDELWI